MNKGTTEVRAWCACGARWEIVGVGDEPARVAEQIRFAHMAVAPGEQHRPVDANTCLQARRRRAKGAA